MALVSVLINGHSYTVGCENGQERHVQAMAHQVEHRVQRVRSLGFSGDARVLVLAALLMADEIQDLSNSRIPESTAQAVHDVERLRAERAMQDSRLLDLAERAEALAAELEQAYIDKAGLPGT
ncbi:hypothetical protein APE01nite_15650 [Acetobacter peroxydans]|jgi:cell division protein ZapA|uniref:Cell division protein ZapA n=1 Tax=Acetobacter peroxydans TaxID=104098 RepID=A0A4Y3TVN3_9PROT|nr:hypothetical protein AA13755_0217 [Acetobacter peroxydans NBRC 13755]GBR43106.1 hypothetical protein AA0475_1717 [Acetobacter peroxydans]GEB85768.1 hypothetical protein APE01nite_15650 [Acetobacter peroxydans]